MSKAQHHLDFLPTLRVDELACCDVRAAVGVM